MTTHVVAFALDSGLQPRIAGNLLAIMGITGLIGVLASGYWGDRSGPAPATIAAFAARWRSGQARLSDEIDDFAWIEPERIGEFLTTPELPRILARAAAMLELFP